MRAKDFCTRGYFPEIFPPIYSSKSYGENVADIIKYIEYPKINGENAKFSLARFSGSKRGHARRQFSVPHPLPHFNAAHFISEHWNEIESHLGESNFSETDLRASDAPRAIRIRSHKDLEVIKIKKLLGSKYVATTDISKFYPSIYTHSIPWAVHGKEQSKQDTKFLSDTIQFNKLDKYFRDMQEGQTVGIPIGPDISRVVAELIGTGIDQRIAEYGINSALRHVDDIFIGTKDFEDSSFALHVTRRALSDFELIQSDEKTKILRSSQLFSSSWPTLINDRVRALLSTDETERKQSEIVSIISESLNLATENQDGGIIKYALKGLDSAEVWKEALFWDLLEPYLSGSLLNFPHATDYIAQIVSYMKRIHNNCNIGLWSETLNQVVISSSRQGHDFEASWAIWLLRELEILPSPAAQSEAFKSLGPIPISLLTHYLWENLSPDIDAIEILKGRMSSETITGPFWPVFHEAYDKGWNYFDVGNYEIITEKIGQFGFLLPDNNPSAFYNFLGDPITKPEFAIGPDFSSYEPNIADIFAALSP